MAKHRAILNLIKFLRAKRYKMKFKTLKQKKSNDLCFPIYNCFFMEYDGNVNKNSLREDIYYGQNAFRK